MLEMRDVEERAAKCNLCATELSIIENLLYGNRCVFCLHQMGKTIGLWEFLIVCRLEYKIFTLVRKLRSKLGAKEARMLYLGCVAEAGASDPRGIVTATQKRTLIKILNRYK